MSDTERNAAIIFGPIPSRRLGRSLGINNIPPKICSYSCIYCQIGPTNAMTGRRQAFFSPDRVFEEAAARVSELREAHEQIDFLTFVPDGEPTLDINLGRTISRLRSFGIKIAVITNASLIWDPHVRGELMNADWVSLKIDTVDEEVWKNIDRPHGSLSLKSIMDGASEFSRDFRGTLVTETMLVRGVNDSDDLLHHTADFIGRLNPSKAYVLIPTRPPAEKWVLPPDEEKLNAAYQIFGERIGKVELLTADESTDFTFGTDVEKELLAILAVHPMTTEAVKDFLDKSETSWELMERLIADGIVREVGYSGRSYILKTLRAKR